MMPDDWIAAIDQMLRGLKDLGKTCHAFYSALIEEGFTEDQAFVLTRDWLRTCTVPRPSDDD